MRNSPVLERFPLEDPLLFAETELTVTLGYLYRDGDGYNHDNTGRDGMDNTGAGMKWMILNRKWRIFLGIVHLEAAPWPSSRQVARITSNVARKNVLASFFVRWPEPVNIHAYERAYTHK